MTTAATATTARARRPPGPLMKPLGQSRGPSAKKLNQTLIQVEGFARPLNTALRNAGDSSVDSSEASVTASLTTTFGAVAVNNSSNVAMRAMMRSTRGMRSSVQPSARCSDTVASICRMFSATPRTITEVRSRTVTSPAARSSSVATGSVPRRSDSNSRSSACLRALCRAEVRGRALSCGALTSDAAEVAAIARVDLHLLAGHDEQRDLDLQAGLDGRRLGAAGRPVTLQAGLGVGDLELDRRGHVDEERDALVDGHRDRAVLEEVVLGVAHRLFRDDELRVVGVVHEHVAVAVVVQVLHLAAVHGGRVDLGVGVERAVDDLAAQHVLELRAYDRVALARLVVLEPDDAPQLTVEVEHHAVLEIVGRSHEFPFAVRPGRSVRTRARGERRHGDGGQNSTRVGARAPNPPTTPPAWRTSYDRAGWRRGCRRCCRRPRRPRGRPGGSGQARTGERASTSRRTPCPAAARTVPSGSRS